MSIRITVQPGLTANGQPTTDINETIPFDQIEYDDPWDYIVTITDSTSVLTSGLPFNFDPPVISGNVEWDEEISTSSGIWFEQTMIGASFTYGWETLDLSGDRETLPYVSNNFIISDDQIDKAIRSVVTATNEHGSTTVYSEWTDRVRNPFFSPINLSIPTIEGTVAPGQILTANVGIWDAEPPIEEYEFRWERGNLITLGSNSEFEVTEDLIGQNIRVRVRATNDIGTSIWYSSAFTVPIPFVSKLSGTTMPGSPQLNPINMIPEESSNFNVDTGWNYPETIVIENGTASLDGNSTSTSLMTIPLVETAVSGNRYGGLVAQIERTTGTTAFGMQAPGNADNFNGSGATTPGYYSRQLLSDGNYTHARMSFGAGSDAVVDYYKLYDIDAMLEKKWRIVFVYSQSNWVGPGDAPDRLTYDTPEPRAIVIPSSEQGTRGAYLDENGLGIPMLLSDPVVHKSGNVGGGPAGAFARKFCDGLRNDEVLVYVACGYSGGGRLTDDDVWYHAEGEESGIAWENLLLQVDGLLDKAPEGSSVAGMLFCQGEADLTTNSGDLHAEVIRGDIELLRERWGHFPVVISEIGRIDTEHPMVANMIESHAKLDQDSGNILAIPQCKYIPRPENATFLEDDLHYTQETQRTRGELAADALLELNYGSV